MSVSDVISAAWALLSPWPVFTVEVGGVPLRVIRFTGHEAISSPFEFHIEVAVQDIDPESLLGKPVVLTIQGAEAPRLVHGIVYEADYIGQSCDYELCVLTIGPRALLLIHRSDCRIFQDKTTQEIVTEVLTRAGLRSEAFGFALTRTHKPRNYCVQYHETDFAFVSRRLEADGIYYYFEHGEKEHVWVMSDNPQAHSPIVGDAKLWFNPPDGAVQDREHIKRFRIGGRIHSGKFSLRDFNLHRPDQAMEVTETAKLDAELERYEFPGGYQDPGRAGPHEGQARAKIRLESVQADRRPGAGESDCPRLTPGKVMTLAGHPQGHLNAEYRIIEVRHTGEQPQVLDQDASGASSYSNTFAVTELKVPFRPARTTPKPAMRGLQSAVVVGPEGEEVHTDEHGRVRVQFHWDREGKFDEHSTCWVRVSQLWAGNGWGAMFLPRTGHEVLVDFLKSDPDRPIITGRIYHGQNTTPYPLHDHKTRITIKSESSPGSGGYNEICFENLKEKEQIFLHVERNLEMRVNNDALSTVWNDAHVTVGRDETKAHLGGEVDILIGGIDGPGRVDLHVRSDMLELFDGDLHQHVRKSSLETVDGSVSRIVHGHEQTKIAGPLAIEAGDEVHVRASRIVLDAVSAFHPGPRRLHHDQRGRDLHQGEHGLLQQCKLASERASVRASGGAGREGRGAGRGDAI